MLAESAQNSSFFQCGYSGKGFFNFTTVGYKVAYSKSQDSHVHIANLHTLSCGNVNLRI